LGEWTDCSQHLVPKCWAQATYAFDNGGRHRLIRTRYFLDAMLRAATDRLDEEEVHIRFIAGGTATR